MGLFDLFSGWGKKRARENDVFQAAQGVLTRYHRGKNRGPTRADDQLLADLEQLMPKAVAQRMFQEFRTRRAHEHPQAEGILIQEIMMAIVDAEHFSRAARPINRPLEAVPNNAAYEGMTRRQRAEAKVLAGIALTDEEEDAMIWS